MVCHVQGLCKSHGVTLVNRVKERLMDDKELFSRSKSYIKGLMHDKTIKRSFADNIQLT